MPKIQNLLIAGVLFAVSAFGQSSGLENMIIRAAKPYDKVIAAIEARGGRVVRVPVERGYSTTAIIERIRRS